MKIIKCRVLYGENMCELTFEFSRSLLVVLVRGEAANSSIDFVKVFASEIGEIKF